MLGAVLFLQMALAGHISMALVYTLIPLSLAAAWVNYAFKSPRPLQLQRDHQRIRLSLLDTPTEAGGRVIMVLSSREIGRNRRIPAIDIVYVVGRERIVLSKSAVDEEAARLFARQVADFLSARFEDEIVAPDLVPGFVRPAVVALTSARKGQCPRCAVALDRVGGPLDEHRCEQCAGRLLGDGGVERLVEQEIGIDREILYEVRTSGAKDGATCPLCTSVMNRTRLKGEEVDLCGGCGALWLDPGELNRLSRGRYAEHPDDVPLG